MARRISDRLSALADMVTPGLRLADIGCDHALLPIRLCAGGKTPSAIAADVRQGPLKIAAENIAEAGLAERIETRLSDGFREIRPGEADAAVIAGMGGMLICRILTQGKETVDTLGELVLGPQSDADLVRETCRRLGFRIAEEHMIHEEGKYYPLLRLVRGDAGRAYSRTELLFGPLLLQRRDPVLHSYLQQQKAVQTGILMQIPVAGSIQAEARRREVEEYLACIEDALRYYREVDS